MSVETGNKWPHYSTGYLSKRSTFRYSITVIVVGLRLVGGNTEREGRLEVRYNGAWGTVCNDRFDNIAAGVACRQLGLG